MLRISRLHHWTVFTKWRAVATRIQKGLEWFQEINQTAYREAALFWEMIWMMYEKSTPALQFILVQRGCQRKEWDFVYSTKLARAKKTNYKFNKYWKLVQAHHLTALRTNSEYKTVRHDKPFARLTSNCSN